jgi:hypothetical protein
LCCLAYGGMPDLPVFCGKKIPVNDRLYKLGLRLSQINFVRRAIDSRADLSEFRRPPTFRILLGVFLICFSLIMCWPVIVAVVGALAWRFHRPWILALGVPLYVLSHILYLTGMFLAGEKYTRIFFKWLTRRGVEKLLAFGAGTSERTTETRIPKPE